MTRRILALVAVLALSVSGVALAAQGKKHKPKTVHTKSTIYAATLFTDKKKKLHAAGEFTDKVLGHGSIVYQTEIVPDTAGNIVVNADHVVLFTSKGSLSGTAKVNLHQSADGTTATLDGGTFKFAHGTAGLKGWSEKGTFTGDLKNNVFKFNVKGTVTKPAK